MTRTRDDCTPGRCLCGCCLGLTAATPVEVFNRPGLSAIAYRPGTHPHFKRSMHAALSRYPALAGLGTRADDDFSIALIAAAQEVPGVSSVEIIGFRRQGTTDPKPLQEGQLPLGRLEIARLDNDPSFPERGVFTLTAVGGK